MPQSPTALQFTAPTDDPAFPSPARIIPPRSPVLQSLSSERRGAGRMRAAACPEGGQEPSPCRAARSGAAAALPPRAAGRFRRCIYRIDPQVKVPRTARSRAAPARSGPGAPGGGRGRAVAPGRL